MPIQATIQSIKNFFTSACKVPSYVFKKDGNSPVKIKLHEITQREQEKTRNSAYKYFTVD